MIIENSGHYHSKHLSYYLFFLCLQIFESQESDTLTSELKTFLSSYEVNSTPYLIKNDSNSLDQSVVFNKQRSIAVELDLVP